MRRPCLAPLLLLVCAASVSAQSGPGLPAGPATPGTPATTPGAVRVFLDCGFRTPCYQDYVKTEITYVDYVTVREAADVHVLVTVQFTGAGGREYTLKFVGQEAFKGLDDEVTFATLPTDSEDLARRGFVRTLQLGLVRYALRTAAGRELSVSRRSNPGAPGTNGQARSARDPWNYWVFRTRLNGNTESESSSVSRSLGGSVSASRVTDAWKLSLSAYQDYRENKYTYSSGSTYTSVRRSHDVTVGAVRSLKPRWSAGAKASTSASTYENKDRVIDATAALEFNLFPYTESTRRELTFQYLVGVADYQYQVETVYGRLGETVWHHAARVSFDMKQTWGSLSSDVDWSQYLHDRSLNRKSISVEADLRLFRGLSLNVNARASGIHDQLYLPKGDATDEEVLARQRQLATSFRRSAFVGLSYTFGSVYSNVVNTRIGNFIGGGGGGGMMGRGR